MMSTNLYSWQLAHNHQPPANYYLSRNMGNGHNSAFIAHNTYSHEDPYLWAATNNNIDGVLVTDDATLFRTNRHLSQAHNHHQAPPNHNRNSSQIPNGFLFSRNTTGNHLAPHNNSVSPFLSDPYIYHQFIDDAYVTADDVNQLIDAMQNLDRNFGSHLSGQPIDYRALLDLGDHDPEVGHQEDDTVMLKTRIHYSKVEVDSEICAICLCEYVDDGTIGTLGCGHDYHTSCIKQWLLRGKKTCPICRPSVLPLAITSSC